MKNCVISFLISALPLVAQTAPNAESDPLNSLKFLQGTWDAKGVGNGGGAATGTYTLGLELGGHILARHSTSPSSCKGAVTFDCEHGDLLCIYKEERDQSLRAIYFDSEGHVSRYDVSTPNAHTVVSLSESSRPGPQFRLMYELENSVMSGKFQMHMPGQADWNLISSGLGQPKRNELSSIFA